MNENKTILLVDDDIDFLMQTETMVKSAGFTTVTAQSQKEAEKVIKEMQPDLAILDLMMEQMDGGFALAYHIKKRFPKVPVIIVSGVTSETGLEFDTTTNEEKSWIKADEFLAKPVRKEQLIAEINKLLGL